MGWNSEHQRAYKLSPDGESEFSTEPLVPPADGLPHSPMVATFKDGTKAPLHDLTFEEWQQYEAAAQKASKGSPRAATKPKPYWQGDRGGTPLRVVNVKLPGNLEGVKIMEGGHQILQQRVDILEGTGVADIMVAVAQEYAQGAVEKVGLRQLRNERIEKARGKSQAAPAPAPAPSVPAPSAPSTPAPSVLKTETPTRAKKNSSSSRTKPWTSAEFDASMKDFH